MSNTEKWRSRYDERAEKYGNSAKANDYHDYRQFKILQSIAGSILKGAENQKILDIGCGNGSMSEPIAKKNTVYGLDFSSGMLKVAQKKNIIPLSSNALHLPLADKSIDATFCFGLLQLLGDPNDVTQCMCELQRVTKPSGILILSTINGDSLLQRIACNIFKIEGKYYEKKYRAEEIYQFLEESSFTVEETYLLYPLLPFYSKNLSLGVFSRLFSSTLIIKAHKK